jgi:hypothetical protein
MAYIDFKLSKDGLAGLLERIEQAAVQFEEAQKALSTELDAVELSLCGPAQSAFSGRSAQVKTGLLSGRAVLADLKIAGSAAQAGLTETDTQIAAGIRI